MKKSILIFSFLVLSGFLFGQESATLSSSSSIIKKYYISAGGAHTKYQNLVQSAVIYSGYGGALTLGTSREASNYFWGVNFHGYYSKIYAWSHYGYGDNTDFQLNGTYLRKLNENLYLGGLLDLFEFNAIYIPDLYNNAFNVLYNSTISPKVRYARKLTDNVKLRFDFQIGLFGLVRESSSFAYNAAQKVLEQGEFDYQNTSTTNAYSLSYSYLSFPSRMNKWQTNLVFEIKDKLEVYYNWQVTNYRFIKGYARTNSMHSIGVNWNFKNYNKGK